MQENKIEDKDWRCPYCGQFHALLNGKNLMTYKNVKNIVKTSEYGKIGFEVLSMSCLNAKCKKLSLRFTLTKDDSNYKARSAKGEPLPKVWYLLPDVTAKSPPDYIPKSIRKDYKEACAILSVSPSSSAVLSRRCLQRMIRDFCKVKGGSLHEEMQKLKELVEKRIFRDELTPESLKFINSIRKIGNTGANMSKPIGKLIDIEPKEAILLIELIEMLFKDWYVARYERKEALKKSRELMKKLVQEKEKRKKKMIKTKQDKTPRN